MNIQQTSFGRGMSALLDSTKTPSSGYLLALNARVRKNGIEPAYRPVQYDTPAGLHQSVFAVDNTLVVAVGGYCYRVNLTSRVSIPLGQPVGLNAAVDYIYHVAVPAPTNKVSAAGTTVDTVPSGTILQDGINQPLFLFPDNSMRVSKTYDQWTYTVPEYIPVGTFMASSGNILFIVSPDGKRIYRSVSGRQTDFVVCIDNNGNKLFDAEGSYLAVAAAPLTCISPAQGGGLLAMTKYGTFGLSPNLDLPLFYFEPIFVPQNIFQVGAVNHLSVTAALGQTLFVSPAGIQSFDQVAQVQRTSNNTPFGAPIIDYVVRPVTITASAMLDDYTFFGLETIFGPGIVVYDGLLQQFVSIDITSGPVKEFCIIEADGLARLFYITASGLYELPLYSGTKRTATVYLGEYTTGEAQRRGRITDVHLGFNNVQTAGMVGVQIWADKELHDGCEQQKLLSVNDKVSSLIATVPRRAPLGNESRTQGLSFDFSDSRLAYANGVYITIGPDARLVSASVTAEDVEESTADAGQEPVEGETYQLTGGASGDSITTGVTVMSAVIGNVYVLYGDAAEELLNGDVKVSCPAGEASLFVAKAGKLYMNATAYVYDVTSLHGLFTSNTPTFLLGDFAEAAVLKALCYNKRLTTYPVLGPAELTTEAEAVKYFGVFNAHKRMVVAGEFVNFYLFSHVTADLAATGAAVSWLRGEISTRAGFHVVLFARPPYGEGATALLQWPMAELGVHLVITGGSTYERLYRDGVTYVQSAAASIVSTPYVGLTVLNITANQIRGIFAEGKDEFTITL